MSKVLKVSNVSKVLKEEDVIYANINPNQERKIEEHDIKPNQKKKIEYYMSFI